MAKHPSALSHLKPDELKTLLIKITAYALRKLGTRAGHSPEMQADDLTHRAIEETLSGQRCWNHEHNTLEQHLTGTINSYISHYFESLAAKSVSHTNGAEPQAQNPTTPEHLLDRAQLTHRIREAIQTETDPLLRQAWHLLETEGWDLKKDSDYFCQRLGLDAASGSAGYQRFNRLRNRIRSITRNCATLELQRSSGLA